MATTSSYHEAPAGIISWPGAASLHPPCALEFASVALDVALPLQFLGHAEILDFLQKPRM